jgi:NADP-dependent 3-hydroxy acid dehydrogenase YdfG
MIAGKVVAVTGASSGIGEATAEYLARRGAKLVLGARATDKLEEVCRRIVEAGGEAEYVAIDVARREDVAALVARSQERFGRLDVLVSNAGVMPIGKLDDLAVDDWERMVDVNVKGLLWGIAAALPVFRAQKSGHFIAIASTAARRTLPTMAVYSGTKAAVAAIMDGLRQEIASELRATTIFPGYTATRFASHIRDVDLRAQLEKSGEAFAMSPEAVAAAIAHAIDQPDGVNVGEIVLRSTAQP